VLSDLSGQEFEVALFFKLYTTCVQNKENLSGLNFSLALLLELNSLSGFNFGPFLLIFDVVLRCYALSGRQA
jgi:hypothetical protein